MAAGTNNCSEYLLSMNQCKKVFVQRDYTAGLDVRFSTKLPQELEEYLDQSVFEKFVTTLNDMYGDAEHFGCKSVCETIVSCLTCHLSQTCLQSQFEKDLKNMARFIQDQNEKVFKPCGLWVTDPIERGLRVMEITILNENANRRS